MPKPLSQSVDALAAGPPMSTAPARLTPRTARQRALRARIASPCGKVDLRKAPSSFRGHYRGPNHKSGINGAQKSTENIIILPRNVGWAKAAPEVSIDAP